MTKRCEHTVIVMGAPQMCDRPIIDPVDEVCDRPGDHVDCDCGDEYGHCPRFQMGEHFAPRR